MKRVRCPKCNQYIVFDETQCEAGQSLVFQCGNCGKQFSIRLGTKNCGSIVVIENVFHYKQVLPLQMGENRIGRYQKGNPINAPIETDDPSVDLWHCSVFVSRDKQGHLVYTLQDANSNTGTFVDNVEIKPRERLILPVGSMFTIGATSILLKSKDEE